MPNDTFKGAALPKDPRTAAKKQLAAMLHIPEDELAEVELEEMESLCDEDGFEYFEGYRYFAVTTTYGAQLEIPETDSSFPEVLRIWETALC